MTSARRNEAEAAAPRALTNDDARAAIAAAAVFAELDDAMIDRLAGIAEPRAYADGATIAAIGQYDGTEFFVVARGFLRVARIDSASGAMTMEACGPGQCFGLAAAAAGAEAPWGEDYTLTAEGETAFAAVDSAGFRAALDEAPSLARRILNHFAARIAQNDLRAAPAEDAAPERRVFAELLSLVAFEAGAWRIDRLPKHREIAETVGVEEAIAAAAIARAIQDGVARREYPGLIVDDIERLKVLAA